MAYEPSAPVVEPKSPEQAPVPVEGAPGAPAPAGGELSDELLQIPALQAVFAGSPPAVSASLKDFEKRPEAKLIAQHKNELMAAGMSLYRSLSGDIGVIFNTLHLPPEQVVAADKAGKLVEIAPPFDAVNAEVAKSGANNPVLAAQGVPNGPAGAPLPSVPQSPGMVPPAAPMPSSAQNKTQSARLANMAPSRPASGVRPGAGRLLNSIYKPVL